MTSNAGGQTILVVDDQPDIRELLRLQLQMKGCQVVEATNGREAVELAPQIHPSLILMDLSMPVLDGYEATRQIHKQPRLEDVPIVAVSAYCDAHNREKAFDAGCIECVCKPIEFGMIDGLLKKHLLVQ
ncbi:MAG: response regulator [Acidobacteriota bacterium]|nr:response regulator [Acidobacteriota bacterium]